MSTILLDKTWIKKYLLPGQGDEDGDVQLLWTAVPTAPALARAVRAQRLSLGLNKRCWDPGKKKKKVFALCSLHTFLKIVLLFKIWVLTFWGNSLLLSRVAAPVYILINSIRIFCILANTWCFIGYSFKPLWQEWWDISL